MGKSKSFKGLALALAVSGMVGGAVAQPTSNSLMATGQAADRYSASDFIAMAPALSATGELAPYENNDTASVVMTTSGGAVFLATLFDCVDPVAGEKCAGAAIYTAAPNSGLAYDDINTFNANSNVSKAVNVSAQNIVVYGLQRFFEGGATLANLEFETKLFLNDMQRHMDSMDMSASQVSLTGPKSGKIDSLTASGSDAAAVAARQIDENLRKASGLAQPGAGRAGASSVYATPFVVSQTNMVSAAIANAGYIRFSVAD